MPAGTAQGIAIHNEYKGATACLVEIDCRPETVNRKVRDGVTGPRVTKVGHRRRRRPGRSTRAASKAQMMGGVTDGIALALTSSLHLATATSSRAAGTTTSTPGSGTRRSSSRSSSCRRRRAARRCRRGRCRRVVAAVACAYARATGNDADQVPDQPRRPAGLRAEDRSCRPFPPSPTDGLEPHLLRRLPCPSTPSSSTASRSPSTSRTTCACCGCCATSSASPARSTAAASTSARPAPRHINGKAFNPCSVPVADIEPTDEVTTIEGLAGHRRRATCTRCRRRGSSTTSPSAATASPARSWRPSRKVRQAQRRGPRDHRRRPRRDPQRLPLRHLLPHPRGDQGGRPP